jgi:hypothetical protein
MSIMIIIGITKTSVLICRSSIGLFLFIAVIVIFVIKLCWKFAADGEFSVDDRCLTSSVRFLLWLA